jgi:hypothetical protein
MGLQYTKELYSTSLSTIHQQGILLPSGKGSQYLDDGTGTIILDEPLESTYFGKELMATGVVYKDNVDGLVKLEVQSHIDQSADPNRVILWWGEVMAFQYYKKLRSNGQGLIVRDNGVEGGPFTASTQNSASMEIEE